MQYKCMEKKSSECVSCETCAYNLFINKAYHMTQKENVENIIKEGLKTDCGRDNRYIYLSSTPNNGFGEVEFEINIDGLALAPLSHWELISHVDISPDRIKLI